MSEQPTIHLKGIGKRYTLYTSPLMGACDALGLGWLVPGRHKRLRHFWALRNIDLTLPRGARIGIIGRNGAGKSTLLKLITRNIDPTEGHIEVNGEVQALLQTGTGMHPEFTGYENIEAALSYQGLTGSEIRDAVADIVDFTELGPFLDQPFKTYSTGMQARLAFATATVVKPDILIIDEVLGVGDGYFVSKSTERMTKLIDSGASVLLVTHSMEQILRFCETAIWVDRGQIVRQGDALEVVKEYERYLRLLEERRLHAQNARRQAGSGGPIQAESEVQYTDSLVVRFRLAENALLRVGQIVLSENDRQQDRLHIGGPHDTDSASSARLRSETVEAWSPQQCKDGRMYRGLGGADAGTCGEAVFSLYSFDSSVAYGFEIDYQLQGADALVEMCRGETVLRTERLKSGTEWQRFNIACAGELRPSTTDTAEEERSTLKLQHWPGLGFLLVDKIRLLGPEGTEQAFFAHGGPLTVELLLRAQESGEFPLQIALTIYRRADGVCVTQQLAPHTDLTVSAGQVIQAKLRLKDLTVSAGQVIQAKLRLNSIQLGNDHYVISVALFKRMDPMLIDQPERYDLVDRSAEFKVYGREPHRRGIFQHPGQWEIMESAPRLKSA